MRGRQKSSVRAQVEFRGLIENAENLKNIESAKRDLGGESKRNRGGGGGWRGKGSNLVPIRTQFASRMQCVPGTETPTSG